MTSMMLIAVILLIVSFATGRIMLRNLFRSFARGADSLDQAAIMVQARAHSYRAKELKRLNVNMDDLNKAIEG